MFLKKIVTGQLLVVRMGQSAAAGPRQNREKRSQIGKKGPKSGKKVPNRERKKIGKKRATFSTGYGGIKSVSI